MTIVTALLLFISYLIKYPDKISCSGVITTEQPPIAHLSRTGGIIEEIFVKDGEYIQKKESIIYFQNNADREDIDVLLDFIEGYKTADKITYALRKNIPENLILGDLQQIYAALGLKYREYQQVLRQSGVFRQINTISHEIEKTRKLITSLEVEKSLFKKGNEHGIKRAGTKYITQQIRNHQQC